MKTITVEIRGMTALLTNRFTEEAEVRKTTRAAVVMERNPREEATKAAYINKDGTFYFPTTYILAAMTNAGSNHKMKGTRRTLRFVVPSAVRAVGETVTILNCDGPAKNFEVDARPVVIPATKGRIMRYRPRFEEWGAKFDLTYNEKILTAENIQMLLEEAGRDYGFGDFRPEKRGPYGTFRVVKFTEV